MNTTLDLEDFMYNSFDINIVLNHLMADSVVPAIATTDPSAHKLDIDLYLTRERQKMSDCNNICDLPIELLELIMTYVSYDEIARVRSVCRLFDSCSQRLLNRGFVKVEKYHNICFKRVKQQLPRRESERRSHPLARHCDVLSAIETRLSLLGMTYMKYVEMTLCCFIPGKVIDEIYRVLRFIQNNPNPPRVHELLQELRDISSMAMEYFEEKIAPSLKSKLSTSATVMTTVGSLNSSPISSCHRSLPSTSSSTPAYQTPRSSPFGDQETNKSNISNNLMKQMQTSQNTIKKEFNEIKVKLKDFSVIKREITALKSKAKESEKSSLEKDQIIAELKAELEDLKRRMSEYDKKSGVKAIKDEQHVHKETVKRKSQRTPTTRAKRVRDNSIQSASEDMAEDLQMDDIAVAIRRRTPVRQETLMTQPIGRNSRSKTNSALALSPKSLPKRNVKNNTNLTENLREKRIKK
ncbi:unnamed protein product [Medioppia subpectinata]|uniref:F-box domain-containing protein n=1 Tax=Medioppia subpectinata TaxID=1979941 RepID=A0A7R9KN06_9ACAR|nr:unnamed protein product [Medioppia subpectinata]CAG2106254.1 unnamed protein product [Medioppia subpectinata]